MDFDYSAQSELLQARMRDFMDQYVYPNENQLVELDDSRGDYRAV